MDIDGRLHDSSTSFDGRGESGGEGLGPRTPDEGASGSAVRGSPELIVSPPRAAGGQYGRESVDSGAVAAFQKGKPVKTDPDASTVWLEITWSEGYGACVFYYDVETHSTKWELPPEATICKSLSYLEKRLVDLSDLIEELKQVILDGG